MPSLSSDSLLNEKTSIAVAFITTLALVTTYCVQVGIIAIWPDSLHAAGHARHLLANGNYAFNAGADDLPLYPLLMALSFFLGSFFIGSEASQSFLYGHQILIGFHIALMCSAFFPIREMLLRCDHMGRFAATILAAVFILTSSVLPYAPMLSAQALFISLFLWFMHFYDKFLSTRAGCAAMWAGICLGLLLLTQDIAWVIYGGLIAHTLVMTIQKKPVEQLFNLAIIPLFFIGVWLAFKSLAYGIQIDVVLPDLNNGLARFNYIKNGILYLIYAGMPLAGLAFMVSCVGKPHEKDSGLKSFVMLMLIGVLIHIALSNAVIVETKLDYITNRPLDPFLILPFLAYMRMPLQQRKETTANSMLLFFCLMIFGFPYALKADFLTGISYWAQSLDNPNLGIIRNIIYLLLLSLPIIVIWWKPRFFVLAYGSIAAVIGVANIAQNYAVWSVHEDGNFKYVNLDAFAASQDIKNASAIFVENRCDEQGNNDIGYLFRCNDLNRLLYFIPRISSTKPAMELGTLQLKPDEYILFTSSEHDNAFGKTVAQVGLGNLMRIEARDITALQKTPLVQIKTFENMGRYVNVRFNEKMERVTLLGPDAVMHIEADKAGCVELNITFADDGNSGSSKGKTVEFYLNKKLLKKAVFQPLTAGNIPQEYALALQLNEGGNDIALHYQTSVDTAQNVPASLFMFGRPRFKSCR